jgi:hypothetical protein
MARLGPDWEVRGDSSLHIDTIAADHNLSAAVAQQGNAQFAPDSSSGEVDGEICHDISPVNSVDDCDIVRWKLAGLGGSPPPQSDPNVRQR